MRALKDFTGIFALKFENLFEVVLRIEAGLASQRRGAERIKDNSRKGAKSAKFGE